jgi:hypothetical protein
MTDRWFWEHWSEAQFQTLSPKEVEKFLRSRGVRSANERRKRRTKMDKAEVARELRALVEHRLFGAGPWSSDDPVVNNATGQKLITLGLEIQDSVTGNIYATALGAELKVGLMTAFMGHHEPWEVPDILARDGLISSEESCELTDRFEAGEKPEEVLPPLLRVLWRKHFGEAPMSLRTH